MNDKEQHAVGLKKFSLISPVINGQEGNASEYFRRLAAEPVVISGSEARRYSEKTFAKWLYDYRRYGFDSLVKSHRSDKGARRKISAEAGEAIAQARIENPKMPVTVLYEQLISNGVIDPLEVSRPTVYRYIEDLTLSGELSKSSESKEIRRFSHEKVNEMWQSDLLYGPILNISKKKVQTYLHAILDDCSRYPMWSQFYDVQNFESFRHCFREAVQRRGAPLIQYTDNAKIYRSQQFEFICASLGCTLIHSQPFVPRGRGKVERFFRTVRMRFLSTLDTNKINSINELNTQYFKWLEEDYKRKSHSALNGLSPHDVLMSQVENLKIFTDTRMLDEAFLYRVSRKVQHDATIQLDNILYETEPCYAGKRLEIRYLPEWVGDNQKKLPLYFDGKKIGDAWMVRFHDNARAKRKFPGNRRPPAIPEEKAEAAISFSDIMEGGNV
jgi:transposase InsO family protein